MSRPGNNSPTNRQSPAQHARQGEYLRRQKQAASSGCMVLFLVGILTTLSLLSAAFMFPERVKAASGVHVNPNYSQIPSGLVVLYEDNDCQSDIEGVLFIWGEPRFSSYDFTRMHALTNDEAKSMALFNFTKQMWVTVYEHKQPNSRDKHAAVQVAAGTTYYCVGTFERSQYVSPRVHVYSYARYGKLDGKVSSIIISQRKP